MKDYTLSDIEKKNFVLYYEVVEDKIIIYNADGSVRSYAHNLSLEKRVLKKMREQVLNSDEFYKLTLLEKSKYSTLSKYSIYIWVPAAFLVFSNGIGLAELSEDLRKMCVLLMSLTSFLPSINHEKITEQTKIINDIEKNRLFVKNEELLQVDLIKEIMPIVDSFDIETEKLIRDIIKRNQPENVLPYPTINDLDNISFSALKDLTYSLKKYKKEKLVKK